MLTKETNGLNNAYTQEILLEGLCSGCTLKDYTAAAAAVVFDDDDDDDDDSSS